MTLDNIKTNDSYKFDPLLRVMGEQKQLMGKAKAVFLPGFHLLSTLDGNPKFKLKT